MKITSEINLVDFEFWSGAKTHNFENNELNDLELILIDHLNNPSETDINDLFWFEEEFLCRLIGLNYNEYSNR